MPATDFIPAAAPIITSGLGLLLEGHEDQRQQKQQKALTKIASDANKDMGQYNLGLQKDMWNYTNYENQVKHLKNAGLNPALLYGKGGAGGATANISAGNVGGANAAGQSGEIINATQMGIQLSSQLALQNAQKEALLATAEKDKAQANKISGVDTEETTANIQSIIANTTNTQAKTLLTNIQQKIETLNSINLQDITEKGYLVELMASQFDKINQETVKLQYENYITNGQKDTIINNTKQTLYNNILQGQETKTKINLTQQQITQIDNLIKQGWEKLDKEQQTIDIEKNFKDTLLKYMPINTILNAVNTIGKITK